MARLTFALETLLADSAGPVSIVGGIAALRAIGVDGSDADLQSLIGTFTAYRGRPIKFDRLFTGAAIELSIKP